MTVTESEPGLAGLRVVDFSSQIEHLLFETDFPHPTCTYPDGVALALDALAGLDAPVVTALMGGNAARLYNVVG